MEKTTPPQVPMSPVVFEILLALADQDRHGYGIMLEVERRTEGSIKLGPGTLYGAIKRMLATGAVEESGDRPDPSLDDKRRRYYRLTNRGRQEAIAEASRLERQVRQAHEKQLLPNAAD